MSLRPVQAAALCEAHDCQGLVMPAGVGSGKTLTSFLVPRAVGSQRPLLMVPAKLKHKTEREYEHLQREWVLPQTRVISYEFLSREQNAAWLDTYQPDLIVCDEGHKLKNPKAAVTRRVQRYIRARRPRVVVMSGTFTRRSLMDYWHILRWCLGDEHMPLPADWQEVMSWADALDVKGDGFRTQPGALSKLCNINPLFHAEVTVEEARAAYRRRLTETPGVVATAISEAADCSIYINHVNISLGPVAPHFETLRTKWETPDGHPFSEAVDLWRHARELVCGFYYVWDPRPPMPWLAARRAWCKYVRETLKHSRKLDSELQVVKAVDRGELKSGVEVLAEWRAIRDTFVPNLVPRWVDDTTLRMAAKWLHDHVGIVWVEHRAFGEKLASMSGAKYYGQGGKAADGSNIEDEKGPCIASIAANAEGRNLQRFHQNLVVSCPPNGATWEQLIGRTHRPGQQSDEVVFETLLACTEQWAGMQRAIKDAQYIQSTTGSPQKLLFADIDIPNADEVALMSGDPLWG